MQEVSFCLLPPGFLADKFEMPKFAKGHISGNIRRNLFESESGDLLIKKFQAPSLNSFWDILLTSSKCPNFQRAITPENFDGLSQNSGNLLIFPYQLNKLEAPSSNGFRDILLTSLKSPYFQRAITPEKTDGIHSKVNQVIYSSSSISWPSFRPLAQILFEKSCWQVWNAQICKGP